MTFATSFKEVQVAPYAMFFDLRRFEPGTSRVPTVTQPTELRPPAQPKAGTVDL